MKIRIILRTFIITCIVLLNASCDQISKDIVRKKMEFDQVIYVIKDNFILTKVENTGAALSLGENLNPQLKLLLLQILPLIVLAFLFRMLLIKNNYTTTTIIGFCFIIGGGIGNVYDRILYGSVTDFMHLQAGLFKTGIFNMADVSVVIGVLLILLDTLISYQQKKKIGLISQY